MSVYRKNNVTEAPPRAYRLSGRSLFIIPYASFMILLASCNAGAQSDKRLGSCDTSDAPLHHNTEERSMNREINKTDEEWRAILTPEQYHIMRGKGTERPFTGVYNKHYEEGAYLCGSCGAELFRSDAKYDSGSGWPSFRKAAKSENVEEHTDRSHGMLRTEVLCRKCGAHMGHVFDDGPKPTGLRYCINSASLRFEEKDER